jgi:hemolysin activation/secretion protein
MVQPDNILPDKKSQKVRRAYQGRCLYSRDLVALQTALDRLAFEQGLVTTRVMIPEQDLSQGDLQLNVIMGHVEALSADNLTAMELLFASPVKKGELLQLRRLEQTIENINRLSSYRAKLELKPGEQVGGSEVAIAVERSLPLQLSLTWQGTAINIVDISRNIRAQMTVDSPLKLADRFVAGLNGNLESEMTANETQGYSFDYDVPIGWWRLALGSDQFMYRQMLLTGLTPIHATGHSQSWHIDLAKTGWRNSRHRLSSAFHYKQRIQDNFLNGVTLGVSSYRLQSAGIRFDHSWVRYPWVLDSTIDFDQGETRSLSAATPFDPHYLRIFGNQRMQYQFGKNRWTAEWSGQWSSAILAPSELFSLTGQVSGYEPLSINSESGVALRSDLSRTFNENHFPFQMGIGLSTAQSMSRQNMTRITAASAKILFSWKALMSQIKAAWPIDPSKIQSPHDWQLDANLSVQW